MRSGVICPESYSQDITQPGCVFFFNLGKFFSRCLFSWLHSTLNFIIFPWNLFLLLYEFYFL